jgi:hypothetical protein
VFAAHCIVVNDLECQPPSVATVRVVDVEEKNVVAHKLLVVSYDDLVLAEVQ